MNKTLKIYGIIFLVIIVLLAIFEVNKKPVVDWSKNFDVTEKTPFGLYIFNQESAALFKNKLKKTSKSPYEYYNNFDTIYPHNILLIDKNLDAISLDEILLNVEEGSDLFVFDEKVQHNLVRELNFRFYNINFEDSQELKLTDKKMDSVVLKIDKFPGNKGFPYIDKNTTEILGTAKEKNNFAYANFVKVKYGEGNVYVHAEPLVLTNYYLLNKNSKTYVENVLSYLPERETVWFGDTDTEESESPVRFILQNPALRYSWYILLVGVLLFMIFHAKRRQRIVPIIEPLKNKSVEFVKSIGNLYLQEGDFHDMMAKKAQYFLHKVRIELMIDTQNLDENFAKKLHLKTGASLEKIQEAIVLIKKSQDSYAAVINDDLIRMNRLLDEILK